VEAIRELTGGEGVDSAIEALGGSETFQACVRATRPGGTISNVGYHGDGETVGIPRAEWGVGMSDKTIRTALCPGGLRSYGASDAAHREQSPRSAPADDASLPLRRS
jgi:threonine dehydrogenase-like Zn-dependent dehydrogenase